MLADAQTLIFQNQQMLIFQNQWSSHPIPTWDPLLHQQPNQQGTSEGAYLCERALVLLFFSAMTLQHKLNLKYVVKRFA